MCQKCLRAVSVCENETELLSARLGVRTPGAKCIRLGWSVRLSLAIVHFERVQKSATACQDNSLYRVEWRTNNVLREWNQLRYWHLSISRKINKYMAKQSCSQKFFRQHIAPIWADPFFILERTQAGWSRFFQRAELTLGCSCCSDSGGGICLPWL